MVWNNLVKTEIGLFEAEPESASANQQFERLQRLNDRLRANDALRQQLKIDDEVQRLRQVLAAQGAD